MPVLLRLCGGENDGGPESSNMAQARPSQTTKHYNYLDPLRPVMPDGASTTIQMIITIVSIGKNIQLDQAYDFS